MQGNGGLLRIAGKGFCVGGTMLVPGISGGSIAMILGIYDPLIFSVSSLRRQPKESLRFLGTFSLGGLLGMLLVARPLLHLIEQYPMPMLYFFLGAVAGGMPMIYRKAKICSRSWRVPAFFAAGLLTVLFLSALRTSLPTPSAAGETSLLWMLAAGMVAAVALVLPGISVSYLLLVLGVYDPMMRAIRDFDLAYLLPLGIGLLLGIALTARLLEYAMKSHPQPTYLMILGFVAGSAVEIFPGIPSGGEWLFCLLTLGLGFFCIYFLARREERADAPE